MHRSLASLSFVSLAIVGAVAAPQDPAARAFVLEPGTHALTDLIDRSSKFLGRNTLYTEAEFSGRPSSEVVLQQRLELDAEGCEDVVGQLLFSKGFAVVPMDAERAVYEVIALEGPRRAELSSRAVSATPAEVVRMRQRKVAVRCTVKLEGAAPAQVMMQLRPYIAGRGPGTSVVVGNVGDALLIEGFADQVAGVLELLATFEQPARSALEAREELERAREKSLEVRIAKLEKRVVALERRD